ncbi:MAG: hypothetical protein ABI305_13175 [Tepidiformaceae bacterium]
MMRVSLCALVVLLSVVLGGTNARPTHASDVDATVSIVVSNAGDSGAAVCPSATQCTLRRAIEVTNADVSGDPVLLSFDPETFPFANPVTISVGSSPLPVVTRDDATIDASAAGVWIIGESQEVGGNISGLTFTGAAAVVRGLTLSHFSGACLSVAGADSVVGGDTRLHQGNRLGECGVGIAVAGDAATVSGNEVGFASDGSPAGGSVGVLVTASNATIGDDGQGTGERNVVGNVVIGVQVGNTTGSAISATRIVQNTIGRDPLGNPAPVVVGVSLRQPSSGATVERNTIAYAGTGIAVAAYVDGVAVTNNRFVQNTFEALTGLAIDLDADGATNLNDASDLDGGANGLLNHPTFTRAVQSRITGQSCGGCSVQLYLASHLAGSPNDYGSVPIAGATVTADASGSFSFENPAATSGQWVTAVATDAAGNTSEFGPSTRVGTGIAQCGNVTLSPGWNHVGFFGPGPLTLSDLFPNGVAGASEVRAIYHLDDGTGGFRQWFSDNAPGRTLDTLLPGEAYWFYADQAVALDSGFSLSVALPIELKAGWNDIVYIGATADVRDALDAIAGKYTGVYQWIPDQSAGHWAVYGDASTPGWARGFNEMQACGTYELLVTADAVLTPLQP